MLFNSWAFFLFFPIVTLLYFAASHRLRWPMLLAASCVFYMAFVPQYILILLATILVDYYAGIAIERSVGRKRELWLWGSVISTCLILFVFKYFNFFNENLTALAQAIGWNYPIHALALALPVGLSFHTFQSLAYVIEVYRGNQKAEHHFGIYALYVMFYPQLVAGPIERPQRLLHQLHEEHKLDYLDVTEGLKLMAWGFLKKVVVADRIDLAISGIFDAPQNLPPGSGFVYLQGMVLFTIQIYCDFSGYSDIARGSARVMGIRLSPNFNFPYGATSLKEFWRRWHISLSTWFRDYVFKPIVTRRSHWGVIATIYATIITFAVSGLWHGASWNFVAWGLFHGIGLSLEGLVRPLVEPIGRKLPARLAKFLGWFYTFSLVAVGYTFFRARTLGDALYIFEHLSDGLFERLESISWLELPGLAVQTLAGPLEAPLYYLTLTYVVTAVFLVLDAWVGQRDFEKLFAKRPTWFRWSCYYSLVVVIIWYGVWFAKRTFIYFQF